MNRRTTPTPSHDTAARRARRGRRGFSLLEILAVIGIILVLIAIAVVTFGALNPSSKSTRTTLANCEALVKEVEGQLGASWLGLGRFPAPNGLVTKEQANYGRRYGSDPDAGAVAYTRAVLLRASSIPNVKKAIQQLPQKLLDVPPQNMSFPSASGWSVGTNYRPGARVSVPVGMGPPQQYICTRTHLAADGNKPPGTGYWVRDVSLTAEVGSAPIILDAWGNPIILVPGALTGVDVGDQTNRIVTAIGVLDPTKYPPPTGAAAETLPKSCRPFFASAGPDGNFKTGADNLYSFEN